jgi:hypothetical protein
MATVGGSIGAATVCFEGKRRFNYFNRGLELTDPGGRAGPVHFCQKLLRTSRAVFPGLSFSSTFGESYEASLKSCSEQATARRMGGRARLRPNRGFPVTPSYNA